MARFYGTLQGRRGEATRLGDASSGIEVEACSWQGKVRVFIGARDTERKGEPEDMVSIRADRHHNSYNPTGAIFHGTFEELGQLIDWWGRRDQINAALALMSDDQLARLTGKAVK